MFLKFFGKKGPKKRVDDTGGLVNGIDPEMNYCPECDIEFRADITSCSTCNVALISGREKIARQRDVDSSFNGRSMEISNEDELVSIRKGPLKELKSLQKLLEKERIPAILAAEAGGCRKG